MGASELWYAMPVLTGPKTRLEPLTMEHATGYLEAAGAGEDRVEVFRWLSTPGGDAAYPVTLADAERHILHALRARAAGSRLPYAQRDVATGQVIGTTSFYEVDPELRSIAIGHTWLGRKWWRTGHNRDAKVRLLSFAFETPDCVRVVWHTDIYNERSQAAILRLGATREGVLRKHRLRRDGSWRDTVQFSMTDDEWPAAKQRLSDESTALAPQ